MGKSIAMRIYAKCPAFLWDEFYLTATYLHGRTKSLAVNGVTPDKLWYDKKPKYSHIHEIGCQVFVLILGKNNPKIYDRSIECVLIGYILRQRLTGATIEYRNGPDDSTVPVSPPEATVIPSIEAILRGAISQPFIAPEDDDVPSPILDERVGQNPVVQDGPMNDIPPAQDEPALENDRQPPDQPRRSNRIPIPTMRSRLDEAPKTATQWAVRESKRSAEQIREAKLECRRAIEGLHQEQYQDPIGNAEEVADPDQILAVLDGLENELNIEAGDVDPEVPKTWTQALQSSDSERWRAAYNDELKSLKEMGVYCLIPRTEVPTGHRVHLGRPVFALKRDEKGNIVRFKVRHVLQGFNQIYGKEYTKTTSPTVRTESWRILLHLAAVQGWDAMQIDVKTAFLYGVLPEEETTYMEQLRDFEEPGKEDYVCKLEKGLYGMKQAGRIWNHTLNDHMVGRWGFMRLACKSCIYYRKLEHGTVIAAVHVDDFLSIADSKQANEYFKSQLQESWSISNLGTPRQIVGIAVEWDRVNTAVYLSQTPVIDRLIAEFGQKDANPLSLPMEPGLKLRQTNYTTLTQKERDDIVRIPYRRLVGATEEPRPSSIYEAELEELENDDNDSGPVTEEEWDELLANDKEKDDLDMGIDLDSD
ncbi:hypothetical protein E4T56_gene5461 [Termitomyces sp. T112]|nr:hypothetical protein E4T56_gene5461 [Termitomyces sp. T112]